MRRTFAPTNCKSMTLLVALVAVAVPAFATAAAVSLTPITDGRFVIRGEGLERVGGIDLTIRYDATALSSPSVSSGDLIKGAMVADNNPVPGTVRIAIIQPRGGISGSGTIATIAFDSISAGAGATLQAQLVDMKGQKLAAAVSNFAPAANSSPPPEASTLNSAKEGAIRGWGWPGSVTIAAGNEPDSRQSEGRKPADEASRQRPVVGTPEEKPATSEIETRDERKTDASAPAVVQTPPKLFVHKGVIDLFREFRPSVTTKTLTALFSELSLKGFSQYPPVAIADGKSTVKLTICSELAGSENTSFALTGARLVKLKKDESDCFSLDIMPDKTGNEVSLKVVSTTAVHHIPLAVAPAMDEGKLPKLTERDFVLFLRGEGKYAMVLKDREPYFRNFIFTANYLVGKKEEPTVTAPQRPAVP